MLVSRIMTLALRAAGILGQGQTATQDMTQTAFDTLNAMLGQWAAKRWLVYHLVDATVPCNGSKSYSIGPSGQLSLSARPTGIAAAYVSMYYGTAGQIDMPLEIIEAREDFNRITLKGLSSFPQAIYYDNAYPSGLVYPWPIPNSQFQLTVTVKMPLPAFTTVSQDINLPAEYQEALIYNLAVRLRASYQQEPDAVTVALAKASLGTIRAANTQMPRLTIPSGVLRGGRFNVYTGQ